MIEVRTYSWRAGRRFFFRMLAKFFLLLWRLIAAAAFLSAAVLVPSLAASPAHVHKYTSAPVCQPGIVADDCRAEVTATVVWVFVDRDGSNRKTSVNLVWALGTGPQTVVVDDSHDRSKDVSRGEQIPAVVWHGSVTEFTILGHSHDTASNPRSHARFLRGLEGFLLAVAFFGLCTLILVRQMPVRTRSGWRERGVISWGWLEWVLVAAGVGDFVVSLIGLDVTVAVLSALMLALMAASAVVRGVGRLQPRVRLSRDGVRPAA